jgi:hypothetical protein
MSQRTRKWWDVLGKIFDLIRNNLDDSIPERSSVRSDLEKMEEALKKYAEPVSFAMALADQKHKELKNEITRYDALVSEVEYFVGQNEEVAAKRCIFLKRQSAEKIQFLTDDFKRLQSQADEKAKDYAIKRNELAERAKNSVGMLEQVRLIESEKHIIDTGKLRVFEEAKSSFDDSAKNIELEHLKAKNQTLLSSNPNESLDRSITESLEKAALEKEYTLVREKVLGIESDSPKALTADPVEEAKKLLSAPRYHDFVSESVLPSTKVTVRR